MSQAEIDKVMNKDFTCCRKRCINMWKIYFGWQPEAPIEDCTARELITVERSIFGGMDYAQRMVYYMNRFRTNRTREQRDPVRGGPPIQTGESHETMLSIEPARTGCCAVTDWLFDLVSTGVDLSKGYTIETKSVRLCQEAYCAITGVRKRSLQRYVRLVKDEVDAGTKRKKPGRKPFSDKHKIHLARAWFKHYVSLHDYMPHKSREGRTEVGKNLSLPSPSFALR